MLSSVSNQQQGDKGHKTVRRPLFVTRATGAARDEQVGEHKTFFKASRWVYSRAATDRGAGRVGRRFARARVRAEWLYQTSTGSTRHEDQSINSNLSASKGAHCP